MVREMDHWRTVLHQARHPEVSRKEPTLTAKLAACIRELLGIPVEHAKLMTDEQIISLVQFDHILYHSQHKTEPWVDEHWNLDPLSITGHRVKTKSDLRQIGKTRRISKEHEEFRKRLLTPRDERRANDKRTIKSRGFQRREKRT